jgi:hypothetical protein
VKILTPSIVIAVAGLAFSLSSVPAQAALSIDSWQILPNSPYGNGTTNQDGSKSVVGVANDQAHTPTGVNNNITAWSTGGNNGVLKSADFTNNGSNGLGVLFDGESTQSPDHAMDNINGGYDTMLFDFQGKEVSLFQVQIGWYSPDSDISILAWAGDQNATAAEIEATLTGQSYNPLANDAVGVGWDIIGNYQINNYVQNVNAGGISSSYWLVGAYNSAFGACLNSNCVAGNDAIKLKELSVTYTMNDTPQPPQGVPEPSSLLLLAFGMMAPMAVRRRRRKVI